MIYLVTNSRELFPNDIYEIIGVDKSLSLLSSMEMIQIDSETDGRDAHINKLLLFQIGSIDKSIQIVIDCTTIDIRKYKDVLESKFCIGQNLKFDLKFLYNYGIIPRRIYDTMIVEQVLHLGYPRGVISYSLKDIADRRLDVYIDKTIRGEIIWRGIDSSVIKYAANDVVYLYDILKSQMIDCKKQDLVKAAKIECDSVPWIAYMEWCGIHLDSDKWKDKMKQDKINLEESKKKLDQFIIDLSEKDNRFKKYTYINTQGDLWLGFDLTPKCTINWSSSKQVIEIAKLLGFNTLTVDKESGKDKDSVMEKVLKVQKGINDEFLKLYFDYQGYDKVVTSFGQGHLNAINPKTDRIHSTFYQLGCSSGRMSCGSSQNNNDLAKYKGLPINPSSKQKKENLHCPYPNLQQLPSDTPTRSAFTAPKGYLWSSCDFSALESRLGADIYNEKAMLKEFNEGSGDRVNVSLYGNI